MERTRHLLRLRSALRESFPAALGAFADLDAALEVLRLAPNPDTAQLSRAQIVRALRLARRRNVEARAEQIRAILRAPQIRQSGPVQAVYAATVAGEVAVITALNAQIDRLGAVVAEHFGRPPDAEIYTSLPGLGVVLAARVLGEFGDAPHRYLDAKARKAYAGTAPITRASGRKKLVLAR